VSGGGWEKAHPRPGVAGKTSTHLHGENRGREAGGNQSSFCRVNNLEGWGKRGEKPKKKLLKKSRTKEGLIETEREGNR